MAWNSQPAEAATTKSLGEELPALRQLERGTLRAKTSPNTALSWMSGAAALLLLLQVAPAAAGPVVCTTSLEAPIFGLREATGAMAVPLSPVEVTRCGVVQTRGEQLERRAYSWTSPFASGVDLTHQVTDLLGISMGGGDGTRVMGFGFADQTLVWDGTAIGNTTRVLLENQSDPMPLRTTDLNGVFNSSLGEDGLSQTVGAPAGSDRYRSVSSNRPVRGMW